MTHRSMPTRARRTDRSESRNVPIVPFRFDTKQTMTVGMQSLRWILGATGVALVGCGAASIGAAPTPDLPVPSGEARATLSLALDLPQSQDCEEAFDLALYRNRAVHLVEWDANRTACAGRTVRVTYLPRLVRKDTLIGEARQLAVKLTVLADQ